MSIRAASTFLFLIAVETNAQVWVEAGSTGWSPDDSVLEEAMSKLAVSFAAAAEERSDIVPPWASYQLTYQGYIQDGVRLLNVSGRCAGGERPNPEYEEIVIIADGGPCYFDAIYEPTEQRVVYFFLHGHA